MRAPSQARRQGFEVSLGLGHVQQNYLGAVAGEGFGDGGANAACRAGDQRLTRGKRAGPVFDGGGAGFQANHLARDVGAFGRQEKPQRPFQLVLGTLADRQQLQYAAVAQFFGQGAAEPFEGALGAGGERVAETFRRAAEDHQVRAVIEVFQQGLKELAQLLELVGVLQVAGVEHQRLELGAMPGNPGRASSGPAP